jgi:hypothetical protein
MKYLSIIIFFVAATSFSQVGGEQVYSFLNFSTSARQTALGGSVLTITDDVNQPFWNPATINKNLDNRFSFNYVNYLLEINYLSAAYAYTFNDRVNTFHTGITYLNYGTFIAADENGVETGTFKAYDLAFSIGYAYQIPHSDFYIGVNTKIINSVIEQYSSFGIAGDFGILYQSEFRPYQFAAVIRNLGVQLVAYDTEKEPIPLQIQVGGSYQLEHVPIKIYGTLDNLQEWQLAYSNPSDATTDLEGNTIDNSPTFFDNLMRHVVVGAELFPEKGFTLRAGFNVQRAKELGLNNVRTFAGLSFGFGLKVKRIKLNYAFSKFHPAADSHSFSLGINLN